MQFSLLADLRSDTLTKPSPAMLERMMNADTGDDVFGEDPTVNALEQRVAAMFGKEAALYCPTGTMSNQIAIKVHTVPGDEVICEQFAHVYIYEGGGMALNASAQARPIPGHAGRITATDIEAAINPNDIHKARTSLVCLENTSNRGGGTCYNYNEIEAIAKLCLNYDLALHLDGARLFNALVKTGQSALDYGKLFDSISICLNKGLGCPIGSVLTGSESFIRKARRIRKVFGGGMRQIGYMAAAGLYALENNISRLEEDHRHAELLADAWADSGLVRFRPAVETNIVIADIRPEYHPDEIVAKLSDKGVRCLTVSPTQIRMVTHLDISSEAIEHTCRAIRHLF